MQYAFVVNSDACSGCKTCQVACKDRQNLPSGMLWRRVYEVVAGGWQKKDSAWLPTVVAYNLSVACHHCGVPLCATGCQADAIFKRPDGIVLIDLGRCTRCRKCETDCPYGAVQYDEATRSIGKCDFCVDDLETGGTPTCVASCPNRALAFGDLEEMQKQHGSVNRVFPLPEPSNARPALVIKPHRHAAIVQARDPRVANAEEL